MSLLSRPLRSSALAAAAFSLAIACAQTTDLPLPLGAHRVQDTGLSEMSGLELSPTQPGVLWSMNDSGSRPLLYRLGLQGQNLGRVRIYGTRWLTNDWETLATWQEGETTWLLIGDVGDNKGRRGVVHVHAIREPGPADTRADVAWTVDFRYPDGPRDAEGMAIDATSGDLLVLSKRDKPQRLYRVPMSARSGKTPVTAEFVTVLPPLSALATGLDVARDGSSLAVLTYRGLYLWQRAAGESWERALAAAPRRTALPKMSKAEAMAFAHEPGLVYVGSERLPTPLLHLRLE